MTGVYRRAKGEAGYSATRFAQMLGEHGGLRTAQMLLRSSTVSEGFSALWEAGRLDLTVEYQVLLPMFSELFTEDELNIARGRLLDYGFDPERVPGRVRKTVKEKIVSEDSSTINPVANKLLDLLAKFAREYGLVREDSDASIKFQSPSGKRRIWLQPRNSKLYVDLRPMREEGRLREATELLKRMGSIAAARVRPQMAGVPIGRVHPQWKEFRDAVLLPYFGSDTLEPADEDTTPAASLRPVAKVPTDISQLGRQEESSTLEFKSSARWNSKKGPHGDKDELLEMGVVKSVCGFMNARVGGTLIIGVNDSGEWVGVAADYKTLARADRDGYENWLTTLFEQRLGKPALAGLAIGMEASNGLDVWRIDVEPSPRPVFLRNGDERLFFVRFGNSTRRLNAEEMLDYIDRRWGPR